jgi:hypothetical protein
MFKQALLATHEDFTEGSLNRGAIVLLAIPMILAMVMEPLFGIRDVFFVSPLGSMPWRRSASPNRYSPLYSGWPSG